MAPPLSYRDAGVDIDAGNEAVRRIKSLVASTRQPGQISDIGGFAGLFAVPAGLREPVLVSCTDGVGTKLLVSIAMDVHDTVGIDLVAMSVNDLVVTGARPLFLLDYVACGVLVPAVVEALVSGIVAGCRQAHCALLGGETAELPGMYAPGHYDLAAFAVGVVERSEILGPERVRDGDVVLALPSSGLHSNGYSLARRALLSPDHRGLQLADALPGGRGTVGEALLRPTKIYVDAMAAAQSVAGGVHAAAHITGGGLIENPPRVLPPGLALTLDLADVPRLPELEAIAAAGVGLEELRRTFNCGVGMLVIVQAERAPEIMAALRQADEPVLEVGRVIARAAGDPAVVFAG